jgi:hypothetical protein
MMVRLGVLGEIRVLASSSIADPRSTYGNHNSPYMHHRRRQICRYSLPPADQIIGKLALDIKAGAFAIWGPVRGRGRGRGRGKPTAGLSREAHATHSDVRWNCSDGKVKIIRLIQSLAKSASSLFAEKNCEHRPPHPFLALARCWRRSSFVITCTPEVQ